MKADTDGISMILLDYIRYHGVTIVDIDFDGRSYSYVDPLAGSKRTLKGNLERLLQGIELGYYGINYIEPEKSS